MKKTILIIFSMCLILSATCVNAALTSSIYTVSGDCVSNVALYTTSEEFLKNIASDEDAAVVVKSVSEDSYSFIGKNSFVTEKCLLKSGDSLYNIDTVNPIESSQLKNNGSMDISSAFNWNCNYILISFSMQTGNDFSENKLTLKNDNLQLFSFEAGPDGFISVESGTDKMHLFRYSSGEKLYAEIFLELRENTLNLNKLFVNSEEADVNLTADTSESSYLIVYESETDAELENICVKAVNCITSRYNGNYVIPEDGNVQIFENYGTENVDFVYIENLQYGSDAPFGAEITIDEDSLEVEDLFGVKEKKTYSRLNALPLVSKVRLYAGDTEIFAMESGTLTVERSIPESYTAVTALYSENGMLKEVSFGESSSFICAKDDYMKAFLLSSVENMTPVTVAAHITVHGIFNNDGYEERGE